MSCLPNASAPLVIIQGDAATFNLRFLETEDCDLTCCKDISDYDITVKMPGQAGDVELTSTPAVGITKPDPTKGLCQVKLTGAQSETLRTGERKTFYATIKHTTTNEETTVKFRDALNVEARDYR